MKRQDRAGWLVSVSLLLAGRIAPGQDAAGPPGAPPASAPAPSGSEREITEEFLEIQRLLASMSLSFGESRKFCAPDPGSVLAARLALFEHRFGCSPQEQAGWGQLRVLAQDLLDVVGSRGLPETGAIQDVPAQMDRYVLLDILGRASDATEILTSVSTWGADGCIWCEAENTYVVIQRRSEEADRRGDLRLALQGLHEAVLDVPILADSPECLLPGVDLVYARYGMLLVRNGHEDSGVMVLQHLAHSRSDTAGGRIARDELGRMRAVGGTEHARLLSFMFRFGSSCDHGIAVATWRDDDPASVRWLAARLPPRKEEDCRRTVSFDTESFEEARPHLERCLESDRDSPEAVLDAITLLHGLAGGAEPYVERALLVLGQSTRYESRLLMAADERLRWMHGSGPELSVPLGRGDWPAFMADWIAWREETGTRVQAPR